MLALSFLGFASSDFLVAPIAMCGLDNKTATSTYAYLAGLVYQNENDKCTISYTQEGVINSYEAIYKSLGINAIFKRFPGNHNTVMQNREGNYVYTNESIKEFIRNILMQEKKLEDSSDFHL